MITTVVFLTCLALWHAFAGWESKGKISRVGFHAVISITLFATAFRLALS